MPLPGPMPSVFRLTAPAPFVEMGLATVIESVRPAPVSILKLWLAAPLPMVFRPTPPMPIMTVSVPAPPTTEMPANPFTVFRSTTIVSAAELTVMPGMAPPVEIAPLLLAAVIVSWRLAAL